jgi:AcrR family transcriptional regulator
LGYRRVRLYDCRARWAHKDDRHGSRGTVTRSAGRPKDAGSARAEILAAADKLFYSQGIAPVSLAAVAQSAGVTRRTIYYHFASKDDLVRAYLKARDVSSRAILGTASVGDPRQAIFAVFDGLERWFHSRTFRGCALTNAVGERGDTLVIAGPITHKHKRALLDWFVHAAREAGAPDAQLLGEQLMLLFDGALIAATTRRAPQAARFAREAGQILLDRQLRNATTRRASTTADA